MSAANPSNHNMSTSFELWSAFLEPFEVGVCLLVAVGVFAFVKFRRRDIAHPHLPLTEFMKGHSLEPTDLFGFPLYCNICEQNVVEGFHCDACGVVAHRQCAHLTHRRIRCKALSSFGPVMKHHLIKGNLPLSSRCAVCSKECGHAPRLCDFRCIWCKRTVHEDCLQSLLDVCDLGEYKKFIIPPNCVKLKLVGMRPRRQTVVDKLRPPENIPDWAPLIVIGNKKSGSGDSALIQRAFRGVLNPGQVIDVNSVKPEEVLDWINLLPDYTCRILVCGGDGTVGWILNTIEKLKLNPRPAVAILPIGTGNDLSNVLGWGTSASLPLAVEALLDRIASASLCKVDRWAVEVRSARRIGFPLTPPKSFIFNNYVSVGVDALVTLNFHRKREKIPEFFASRHMNKFLYFTYGTMDLLERACCNLDAKLSLECDGVMIDLPVPMEGIVFLNIPSWGAGVDVWNLNRGPEILAQVIDDGYFEVFAIYSSFHIAQMQVGLSSPHRLCRAKSAKLTLHNSRVPMQVDGEPWEQGPAVIQIKFQNQGLLLLNKRE